MAAEPARQRAANGWDHKLEFFRGRGGHAWYALAGVDVQGAVGSSALRLSARLADGTTIDLSRNGRNSSRALPHRHADGGAEVC